MMEGGMYIPPFDHPDVWEGNATLIHEARHQLMVGYVQRAHCHRLLAPRLSFAQRTQPHYHDHICFLLECIHAHIATSNANRNHNRNHNHAHELQP